jgi:hypothetical protein
MSHLNEYTFPTQWGGLKIGGNWSLKDNASHNGDPRQREFSFEVITI